MYAHACVRESDAALTRDITACEAATPSIRWGHALSPLRRLAPLDLAIKGGSAFPHKLLIGNFLLRLVEHQDQSYAQKMPTVFFREGNYIFHRSDDCVQLTKKPARGTPHPVNQADLNDLRAVRPCHTCYPDAPRFKAVRRFCPKCNKKRTHACPHNGGIPVIVSFKTKNSGDNQVNKPFYVWPDHLYRFETGKHDHDQAV